MKLLNVLTLLVLMALPAELDASPSLGVPEDTDFIIRVVGHNESPVMQEDGSTRMRTRFYVTLRRSEENPLPPKFSPDPEKFGVRLARGSALVKEVGNFGGAGGLGEQGACSLLMIDVSGSMVQFWDIIHNAAMQSVDNMKPGDRLGIGFFGGGWEFSGFQIERNKQELKTFIRAQLPESVFSDSADRRALGQKKYFNNHPGRRIGWWQQKVSKELDIGTTKLFYLLHEEVIPRLAECGGEVKALIVLSDMVDESMIGVSGECVPENGCATFDQVKKKALEMRVPIFAIGFEFPDLDTGATANVAELDHMKLLAKISRGEFRQTADLANMDVLFAEVREALDRLIVMDVEFGHLPTYGPGTETNSLTVYYRDPAISVGEVQSLSYLVDSRDLHDIPDFPVICTPPCEEKFSIENQRKLGIEEGKELTVECRDGACTPIIESPCCRDNTDCEPPEECLMPGETVRQFDLSCNAVTESVIRLLQRNIQIGTCGLREGPACCETDEDCEPPKTCLGPKQTTTFDPACAKEGVEEGAQEGKTCAIALVEHENPCLGQMCKTWNEQSRTCEYVQCNYKNDTGCGLGCVCREGTGDRPDHCEPRGLQCRKDGDCVGRCDDTSKPCICELKTPDPDLCPVAPWKRKGQRHCVTLDGIPEVDVEAGEFLTKDKYHVHCIPCESDNDCVEKYELTGYVCAGKRGETRICVPEEESPFIKVMRILIPVLIGLVVLILIFRVFRRNVGAEFGRKKAAGRRPKGPPTFTPPEK